VSQVELDLDGSPNNAAKVGFEAIGYHSSAPGHSRSTYIYHKQMVHLVDEEIQETMIQQLKEGVLSA